MIRKNIAIIGGGVAGLTAAYLLSKKHEVTLFEANDYIGGHTHTITLTEGPDSGTGIDTGFIVCNLQNYPHFCKLLTALNVPLQDSDMSFSYYQNHPEEFYYSSDFPQGLFAQSQNILSPKYWKFLQEILRFNKNALFDLKEKKLADISLINYLEKNNYSKSFIDYYILPMGSAIWSASYEEITLFPAQTFIQFWSNHGLLQVTGRPQWKTVAGGSKTYVTALLKKIKDCYHISRAITSIKRTENQIQLTETDGTKHTFDDIVIATHADQAYTLLSDPTDAETKLLSPWKYSKNHTVLHTDSRLMPPDKKIWASWNYLNTSDTNAKNPIALTYYMNRLQNLKTKNNYFVSLNPPQNIAVDPKKIIAEMIYTHPIFSSQSIQTQKDLPSLNGVQHTNFCGSYFGYGFHEDAVTSAVKVARTFGIDW